MRLAFCTEDLGDEAILAALLERILGEPIEPHHQRYRMERGGWTKALMLAPIVARAVHRTDADGAVFAIDNDEAEPLHEETHVADPQVKCRACALRQAADLEEVQTWDRPGLPRLKFFFAVPVRIIETWMLLASSRTLPGLPETFGRTATERRELKRLLYGTERPDTDLILEKAVPIAKSADVAALELASRSFRHFAIAARTA